MLTRYYDIISLLVKAAGSHALGWSGKYIEFLVAVSFEHIEITLAEGYSTI
jgi:hypothetical protein